VTEYIGSEDETFIRGKLTSPLHPREWNLEELGYRLLGVPRFNTILHDIVLHVEVKVSLTNIVCRSSGTDEHHDFVVPLFTLLIRFGTIDLRWVVRNNAFWEPGAVSIVMVSIRKSRPITWNGFLPSISLVVPYSIGVTVIVTNTSSCTPTLIGKLPFRTTQR
jgi:hypothetical protein